MRAAPHRPRLFCFAHAGGSAASFAGLGSLLVPSIELRGIDLPGHGLRTLEPFAVDFDAMAGELARELSPHTDVPYALLGHSLGALVAFAIAQRLAARPPTMVVIAGVREPSRIGALPDPEDDAALITFARALGGVPDAVWSDSVATSLALRTIRADLRLMRTYRAPSGAPLACDGLVLGGFNDPLVPGADLEAWERHFASPVSLHLLGQGHFFLHTERAAVARLLARELCAASGPSRPLPGST